MLNVLYTIIIFPVEQLIELIFIFARRFSRDTGFGIIGLSIVVSTLILPLYLMAEKQQQAERDKQKQVKRMKDNINTVFKGDKRYMLLSTLYRQNNYHPFYALRNSFSLLIQIPFFIAAYHFLTNLELLNGERFFFIKNLGIPDDLLFGINILPVLMTLINALSGFIYTKDLGLNDKIQVFGIAAVFLVLLYNSPSGLVLYWTCNNIYSLLKNIFVKIKNKEIFIKYGSLLIALLGIIYLLFFHNGKIIKRLIIILLLSLPVLYIFVWKRLMAALQQKIQFSMPSTHINSNEKLYSWTFLLSILILLFLSGMVIPSSLIVSSVQEFSFIENYNSPFPFIINTFIQALGIFIFWPLCLYTMFPIKTKKIFSYTASFLACFSIINVFLFPGKYGVLSLMMTFSDSINPDKLELFLNLISLAAIIIIIPLIFHRFNKIFLSTLSVLLFALLTFGLINNINIYRGYISFKSQQSQDAFSQEKSIYHFSTSGKNVLIIMIDAATSGYIPYIFEEKPELKSSYDGFTWYKNTVSFGSYTNFGTPGIYGGYEYTPSAMQERSNTPLVEKHNEALLLLPKIFIDNNFKVIITDPPYANYSWISDLSIYNDYPEITADNIIGRHNSLWLQNRNEKINIDLTGVLKAYLIRFSFFKSSPPVIRNTIYDLGRWLSTRTDKFSRPLMNNYISLDVLSNITAITDNNTNYFIHLVNNLPHEPDHFLLAPDYFPANEITYKGSGRFSNEIKYHVNIAPFILLGKYFDFLREKNVYNNTRIILVSDHGNSSTNVIPENFILPNGRSLEAYSALLMVKDFDAHDSLSVDYTFMTNADVPYLAVKDIAENPVNPWTGKSLISDKSKGIILTTSKLLRLDRHKKYIFNIKPDEWMHVHTDIFDINNWSNVKR